MDNLQGMNGTIQKVNQCKKKDKEPFKMDTEIFLTHKDNQSKNQLQPASTNMTNTTNPIDDDKSLTKMNLAKYDLDSKKQRKVETLKGKRNEIVSQHSNSKNEKVKEKEVGQKKEEKIKNKPKTYSELTATGYTQDYFSFIKDIQGGMIITNRNRYIYIMEIIPNNFHEKGHYEQLKILNAYRGLINISPIHVHLKCITEQMDISTILNRIRTACPNISEKRLSIRSDHIQNIRRLSSSQTVNYRYFYIFEYEGNIHGYRSSDVKEIYEQMMTLKQNFKRNLINCNNMIAEPKDPNLYVLDILYHLLNRHSYKNESLLQRIMRINFDYDKVGKDPDFRAYFAPRGLVFIDKEVVMMDGIFYTWFAITDTGYPEKVNPDWLSDIRAEINMDIDFFMKKLPHQIIKERMKKKRVWNIVGARKSDNIEKQEKKYRKANLAASIVQAMEEGDDLFDCCTVLTLYGYDPKALLRLRDKIRRDYATHHLETEPCLLDCEEYFQMTLPFLNFDNKVFSRNKRNMTSSALRNTYCFTQYSSFDQSENSIVIGPNVEHGTLLALDKFNINLYPNPHITIIGTSGSGKSAAEMAMGRRDNLLGIRSFYICPLKAHEYYDHCRTMEGSYIRFGPKAKENYNIMELFPEMVMDEFVEDNPLIKKSVLAKKITSLITWLRILAIKERNPAYLMSTVDLNRIEQILNQLYIDFGFNDDNESIWKDKEKKIKKHMPILSYWEERLREDSSVERFADLLIPFTKGNYSNYNRQTNVDITKDCIVCDVDKDDIGEDMLPAIMFLAFDLCTSIIKSDMNTLADLFIDEEWCLFFDEIVARFINENSRILRSYGGSVISASQQIGEFLENKYGQAVIANSSIKILMKMEESEVDKVAKIINIDESDKKYLMGASSGDMLIITKSYKLRCYLALSYEELAVYDPVPKHKKKFRQLAQKQRESEKGFILEKEREEMK